MEILFESLGPGVHCYSPFLKSPVSDTSLNLEELCKSVILKCVTLRRLSTALKKLPLPKRLLRFITELTTSDFEKIECAPFSDAFSFNFFHRALTYRVMCVLDGQEYMITYGYSPVEEHKLDHEQWVNVQHKNVMCIWASVKDTSTENIFYVYDQPSVSLEQMWSVFCERDLPIPEVFFWRVTADLSEALKYMLLNGLQYCHFGLDNIFIVRDCLMLENGLLRKRTKCMTCVTEQNMIESIVCILKLLLQSCTHQNFFYAQISFSLVNVIEKK
ncbi:hypothetical protein X975_10359, partial [Stegodyphus mimosarum]